MDTIITTMIFPALTLAIPILTGIIAYQRGRRGAYIEVAPEVLQVRGR